MQMQMETNSPYIKDVLITDLGFGGGFALWGIRAIASGQGNCCHLSVGFNRAFAMDNRIDQNAQEYGGTNGRLAINLLKSFSYQIRSAGRRKILLSGSGCMRVTPDEACLVAALAAGQRQDKTLALAHLRWLLAGRDTLLSYEAALSFGAICQSSGILIETPDCAVKAPKELENKPAITPMNVNEEKQLLELVEA